MPEARSALARRAACVGLVGVGADQRGDLAGQGGDALDPLGHGAQLGVEGDAGQLLAARRRSRSCGPRPRRSGRRSGGPTAPWRCRRRGPCRRRWPRRWRRRRSAGPGLPVAGSRTAKYFWCTCIDGADHLGRQVQELRVHVAQDRRRPFGQAGDLVQQAVVLDQFQALARDADGVWRRRGCARLRSATSSTTKWPASLSAIVGEVA